MLLGEYNAGKSTLLNALLELPKNQRLPVSDDPTNARPLRLRYKGATDPEAKLIHTDERETVCSWATAVKEAVEKTRSKEADIREIILFVDHKFLLEADFLDMPGTGSGWHKEHQDITRNYIENAEAVLWVIGSDEPSKVGREDYLIARAAKVPMIAIFNAWGYLDPRRDAEMGIDQKAIENATRKHYPDLFARSQGFRAYARKCLEAKDVDQEIDASFGLHTLKAYLADEFLGEFVDIAHRRRENIRRQVGRSADETLRELKKAIERWDQKGDQLVSGREDQKVRRIALNVLEHKVRVGLRLLAHESANKVLDLVRRQTETFLDDKVTVSNLELFKGVFNKDPVSQ